MTEVKSPLILLVDDEEVIIYTVGNFLELSGFQVMVAYDGVDALAKIKQTKPDLIVLDVLMPNMNGRALLRELRKQDNWIPVILLTQISGTPERIMALEEGADDYLNKPFDPQELVVRIRAVLRRVDLASKTNRNVRCLQCNTLVLDRLARRLRLDDKEITVTPKAFAILEYMLIHPDELITREQLLDIIWGWQNMVGERVVDTRIAELRKVLNDDSTTPTYIETMPGQGYRFIGEVKEAGSC
ncbi:MAG: response regulator transcription factor [Aggregatilineales bacterium]